MTRPTLHLTVGLPGVGKTTLARKISHEDEAVRFSSDEWMIARRRFVPRTALERC